MFALLQRNIKMYFSNVSGVILSCLGALISFFIYIGFLQKNLESSWQNIPHTTEILDLWMIAGIVTIAGITTSFQALGQLVEDRESRADDDMKMTDVSPIKQKLAYVLSSSLISLIMQILTFAIMAIYFTIMDKIRIPNNSYLPVLLFMLLGSIVATLLNLIIVFFIHSVTAFSRLVAIISAAAGFLVATYMPYGALTNGMQTLVKLIPGSYEAAGIRSLLLDKIMNDQLDSNVKDKLIDYLGIHFKLEDYQLTTFDNAYVIIGMIILFVILVAIIIFVNNRKVKAEVES